MLPKSLPFQPPKTLQSLPAHLCRWQTVEGRTRDKEGQDSENPLNMNLGLGSLFGKVNSFFFLSDFIRFFSCYILYGSGTYGWGSFSSLNEDSPSLECYDRLGSLTSTQCVQIFLLLVLFNLIKFGGHNLQGWWLTKWNLGTLSNDLCSKMNVLKMYTPETPHCHRWAPGQPQIL